VLTLRAAATLEARINDVPWLAGVFFLGGIGRLISWMAVGAPHPFFLSLMAAELGLPLILIFLWLRVRTNIAQTRQIMANANRQTARESAL
jgi:hypothetical protein